MTITISSAVTVGDQNSLLGLIGATGALQFFDNNGAFLSQAPLPNPAGVVCGQSIVFNGLAKDFGVSSNAPVGAVPFVARLVDSAARTLIDGIPIMFASMSVVIASSAVTPGGNLSVAMALISSAGH